MRKVVYFLFLIMSYISYSEFIENIDVKVSLNKDKSVHIKKIIDYNPENEIKRGIILDIIYNNTNSLLDYNKLGIKNFSSNVNAFKIRHANYNSYRLGDKNIILEKNKKKRFIVEYDIYNILKTNGDLSQIYLNVIGNSWNMPIKNINIDLNFNEEIIKDLYVFTGEYKKNTNNYSINGTNIKNIESFNKNEGLTIKLNLTYPYTNYDKFINILNTYENIKYNLIIIIVLSILIVLMIIKIKKENSRLVIKPEFRIDKKISPALAKKIANKTNYSSLTIVFISLITKGILDKKDKYEEIEYVKRLDEKEDIEILKNEKWQDDKEKIFYIKPEYLDFENIKDIEISPSEKLALNNFSKYSEDIFKNIKNTAKLSESLNNLVDRIYEKNIAKKIIIYKLISILTIFISIVLNLSNTQIFDFLSILIVLILFIISFYLSSKIEIKTKEGINAYQNILGYIMFYENVEQNIFKEFNSEKEIITYAKKMLPYMLAIGLEAKFLNDLDNKLTEINSNISNIYSQIYYPYIYNIPYIDNRIKEDIYKNSELEKQNIKHSNNGFFSGGSSGYSGGGYSGGGGKSW